MEIRKLKAKKCVIQIFTVPRISIILTFLNDLMTNDFATRLLVLEHQTILVGVNRNGLLALNLVRKNLP